MNLVINGLRLMSKRLGVGRYIEHLLLHWRNVAHPFDRIIVYTPGTLEESIDLPPKAEHRIVRTRHSCGFWEQLILPRLRQRDDVLFCPSYVAPILGRGKTVVTHHGSYEAIPSAFPLYQRWKSRAIYQLSARRADHVITVSESSKKDIIRFYGISPKRITVIYNGVDTRFQPISNAGFNASTRRAYLGEDRPYILFVGKLTRRRNIPELITAFVQLKRARNLPHLLFLIGPDTAGQDVARRARDLGVESSVVYREFVAQRELAAIYNAADLFVYPSSYEGFGLPVLEAMACAVPTIALRNSSLLEFADGAVHFARDESAQGLREAMEEVLFSPDLRNSLRKAGREQAQRFNWPSIAHQTMELLAEVAAR